MADSKSTPDRRLVAKPGVPLGGGQGIGASDGGTHAAHDHDLVFVSVSEGEVRFRTRLRLKVGRSISYALETPEGRHVLTGQVQRSTVVAIGADGLTFEIGVSLERPFPPLAGARLAMVQGRGAASSSETGPTLTFVALENEEGPDLDGLLDMADE